MKHLSLSHTESNKMYDDLKKRKLGLDNYDFINRFIDDIVLIVCHLHTFAFAGTVLLCQSWLDEQTDKDKAFIEDYASWRFATITE